MTKQQKQISIVLRDLTQVLTTDGVYQTIVIDAFGTTPGETDTPPSHVVPLTLTLSFVSPKDQKHIWKRDLMIQRSSSKGAFALGYLHGIRLLP